MENKYKNVVENIGGVFDFLHPEKSPSRLSVERLTEVEEQLECILPSDYKEFLASYGGYGFSNVVFPVAKEHGHMSEGSLFVAYGASADKPELIQVYQSAFDNEDLIPMDLYPGMRLFHHSTEALGEITWPKELLPIGSDMGGNQICLVISGSAYGAIFQWISSPSLGNQNVYFIAPDFDIFMNLLTKS